MHSGSLEEASVIHFVDDLILEAIQQKISDVHLEPYEKNCRIRFRANGMLYESKIIGHSLSKRVISRIKIMAKLNIAEQRLPQDGHIYSANANIRVNTCPTLFGEKLVMRLLNLFQSHIELDALGFTSFQKDLFLHILQQPQGLILVTGPTGSGKTSTLYAALALLNQSHKNLCSVENPIEIKMDGVNQVNVDAKIGLDFSTVLRAFLRQDPDVIMIGEIRDKETATIAIQAAQTGHLVLSTLHSNDTKDALTRLETLGVSSHQLIHSLLLIMAQRLIRTCCIHCQKNETKGCGKCQNGYLGRTGIFECLPFNNEIKTFLAKPRNFFRLTSFLKAKHWMNLYDAGMEKIKKGLTNHQELVRVIGANNDFF